MSWKELLRCAGTLVKPGGVVLYVTCALAEAENDGQNLKSDVFSALHSDGFWICAHLAHRGRQASAWSWPLAKVWCKSSSKSLVKALFQRSSQRRWCRCWKGLIAPPLAFAT